MTTQKWIHKTVAFCLMIFFLLMPALCSAEGKIGVVLMHGKSDTPEILDAVKTALSSAGFLVETPEMPWSKFRYIDATYDQALYQIDSVIALLKSRGANRIVVAGHSMGANGALAYGAYHGGVNGVVLLAPGFFPNGQKYKESIALAKKMISEGNGNQKAAFEDGTQGFHFHSTMRADVYLSYFSPHGMGRMGISAAKMNPNIPVLCIEGKGDRHYVPGEEKIFENLPPNPYSKYVVVDANHEDTKEKGVGVMIEWLKNLPE